MAGVYVEWLQEAAKVSGESEDGYTVSLVITELGVRVQARNQNTGAGCAVVVGWKDLMWGNSNPLLPAIEQATKEVH